MWRRRVQSDLDPRRYFTLFDIRKKWLEAVCRPYLRRLEALRAPSMTGEWSFKNQTLPTMVAATACGVHCDNLVEGSSAILRSHAGPALNLPWLSPKDVTHMVTCIRVLPAEVLRQGHPFPRVFWCLERARNSRSGVSARSPSLEFRGAFEAEAVLSKRHSNPPMAKLPLTSLTRACRSPFVLKS